MAAQNQKPKKPDTFHLLPKILNGSIACIVGVGLVFPLDLVKTRLQNQSIGPNGEKQYKNMLDCLVKTYKAEGYFGMYRGAAVNILLVTPEKAIKLAANDYFRYYLTLPDGSLPMPRQMLAGGLAGAYQSLITTPMELLKIQLQDQGRVAALAKSEGKTVERLTATSVALKLLRERGLLGLYKGILATSGRDIMFAVIYFPMFAAMYDIGPREKPGGPTPFWWSFLGGLVAGSTSALAVTPFDVIKTRMQTLKKGKGDRLCPTVTQCIISTWKNEGITAFFKGGACRICVLAPIYGIAQAIYYLGIAEWLLGMD